MITDIEVDFLCKLNTLPLTQIVIMRRSWPQSTSQNSTSLVYKKDEHSLEKEYKTMSYRWFA